MRIQTMVCLYFFSKRKSILILFSILKKILFEKINILFYF